MKSPDALEDRLRSAAIRAQAAHGALVRFVAAEERLGRWVALEAGETVDGERDKLWHEWEMANTAYRYVSGVDFYPPALT